MKFPPSDLIFKTFDHNTSASDKLEADLPKHCLRSKKPRFQSTFPDHMKILTIVGESFRMLPIYSVTSPPNHLATNGIATKE